MCSQVYTKKIGPFPASDPRSQWQLCPDCFEYGISPGACDEEFHDHSMYECDDVNDRGPIRMKDRSGSGDNVDTSLSVSWGTTWKIGINCSSFPGLLTALLPTATTSELALGRIACHESSAFARCLRRENLQNDSGRIFSKIIRWLARKCELQTENQSYSRADPQNPNRIS